MRSIPSYTTNKISGDKNLKSFLNYVEDITFLKETEDMKTGWKYIKEHTKNVSFNNILKNIENFGTDKLIALVAIAEEENLDAKDIFNMLIDSLRIEAASGFGGENFIFAVPVKRQFEVDLHSFKGKLDNVLYEDIYSELLKQVTPGFLDELKETSRHYIHDDKLSIQIPQYYWAAFVDEEKFKDQLVQRLQMSEDQIEDLAKIG